VKTAFGAGTNLEKIGIQTENEMHIKMLDKMLLEPHSFY